MYSIVSPSIIQLQSRLSRTNVSELWRMCNHVFRYAKGAFIVPLVNLKPNFIAIGQEMHSFLSQSRLKREDRKVKYTVVLVDN